MRDSELLQDAMAAAYGNQSEETNDLPEGHHGLDLDLTWKPRLNPVQELVYRSAADYILAYGERGTGKSIGALHKLVRHSVNNKNALSFVIVREVGQATEGGAWSKLQIEILPQWKHGNYDRIAKKRLDAGCGIEFTAPKLDPSDKKPYIWISNKFGGWSMVKLISLFVGEHVEDKVKGKEPSFIFLDEAQTMESDEYFTKLSQQVGRRQEIDDAQQVVYCCNPKGPSHWLYKQFFVKREEEDGTQILYGIDQKTGALIDPETGEVNAQYAVFHVPITENIQNLPAGYWQRVLEACRRDPVEHARMVEGEWIDKPEGDALFKNEWKDEFHIRGDARKNLGIMPVPGHLFILGWDPGAAHTSIHMMQFIPTKDKIIWLVFDELNCVGKYMPYRQLVPKLVERLIYWEYAVSEFTGKKVQFNFRHIADESAFNQFRAKEGSFDAQDIEDISKDYAKRKWTDEAERQKNERFLIKMRACPKGPHSVEARVRVATDLLIEQSLIVSATCQKTRDMFMNLEQDKDNRMKPKRSKHLHPFDSLTYPILYYSAGAGKSATKLQTSTLKPEFYRVG
jgi:hypothetical protein